MPVSSARAAAFDILFHVERELAYASELLHSSTYQSLSTPDHALATELVMGVIRWRSRLDSEIATASAQPLSKLDLEILIALRLALYQFLYLDRVPQRAALHESVELVKRARKRSAAPFVNAVLRKLTAASRIAHASTDDCNSPEALARYFAHPAWIVERWAREYGLRIAHQICQHDQEIPTTVIRLRSADADVHLHKERISLAPGGILAAARRIEAGDVTHSEALRSGQIVIQDEGSQLVAALLGASEEVFRILDCCAAPGGKTLALADHHPSAAITAIELHPHRARLLQERLHPYAPQVQVIAADVRDLPLLSKFDRVLADVPCTGTGTLARNPEIKWRLRPDDLAELPKRQLAILRSAQAQVASGGRLVYSTCSLEREENENVVEQSLADDSSFHLLDCRMELDRLKTAGELTWLDPASLLRGRYLRTIPGVHPCDGFFAAILQKS